MFPIRDENPTLRFPIATVLLIGANVFAWLTIQGLGSERALLESLCRYGLIPGELVGSVRPGTIVPLGQARCLLDGQGTLWTPVTSMFMHGGWFHIIANLWFLWIFGDNVEDAMDPVRFVVFYVLCGLAAAAAQVATDLDSTIPMVGASGAIGGVMGAYARLYPGARVDILLILGFYVTTVSMPALMLLLYWFAIQLLSGLPQLSGSAGGVAFWAHIGGFVAGVALVSTFTRPDRLAPRRLRSRGTRPRPRPF